VKQSIGDAASDPQPVAAKTAQPAPSLPPSLPQPASVPTVVTSQPKAAMESRNRMQPAPQTLQQTLSQSMPALVPTIVITQKGGKPMAELGAASGGRSHKKWILLGLVAGAAAGGVTAWRLGLWPTLGQGGATGSPAVVGGLSSAVTIGSPTISLGKP
jgi:hypothetical protein